MNWVRHRTRLVYQEDDGRFALGLSKDAQPAILVH